MSAKWLQSCLILCDPLDWSLPGSFVQGILQARILKWVAISFSKESSQTRDRTWVLQHCHNINNLVIRQTLYPQESETLKGSKL